MTDWTFDPERYKGHTPEPWTPCKLRRQWTVTYHDPRHGTMNLLWVDTEGYACFQTEADANLTTDAPRLLAYASETTEKWRDAMLEARAICAEKDALKAESERLRKALEDATFFCRRCGRVAGLPEHARWADDTLCKMCGELEADIAARKALNQGEAKK